MVLFSLAICCVRCILLSEILRPQLPLLRHWSYPSLSRRLDGVGGGGACVTGMDCFPRGLFVAVVVAFASSTQPGVSTTEVGFTAASPAAFIAASVLSPSATSEVPVVVGGVADAADSLPVLA